VLDAARFRPRGFFFLGEHPWVAVVLLLLVVAVIVYLSRRRR
jgi:hypothetical protein